MLAGHVGVVLAAMVASAPSRGEIVLASATRDLAQTIVVHALPVPPQQVVRETRYFGTVTIDHAAHLARRAACVSCHGPGPVSKLELTPKLAHDRCVGCHKAQARGPIACRDCHVTHDLPPVTVATSGSTAPPAAAPGGAQAVAARTGDGPAPSAAAVATVPPPPLAAAAAFGDGADAPGRGSFRHVLEVGYTGGQGWGPSLRLSSRQGNVLFTHTVERLAGGPGARTLGLLGAGVLVPLRYRVNVRATAAAGFDAVERPLVAFLPTAGASVGVEWFTRGSGVGSVHLSVTGLADLGRRSALGQRAGGTLVLATLATGLALPGAREDGR
jgi:hypothetical protein